MGQLLFGCFACMVGMDASTFVGSLVVAAYEVGNICIVVVDCIVSILCCGNGGLLFGWSRMLWFTVPTLQQWPHEMLFVRLSTMYEHSFHSSYSSYNNVFRILSVSRTTETKKKSIRGTTGQRSSHVVSWLYIT